MVWSQTSLKTLESGFESLYNRALEVLQQKPIRFLQCIILANYSILDFANLIHFNLLKLIFKRLGDLCTSTFKWLYK